MSTPRQIFSISSIALTLTGCQSTASRVKHYRDPSCIDLVLRYDETAAAPDYKAVSEPTRFDYEERVAFCDLSLNRPDHAAAVATSWPASMVVPRTQILARAAAKVGDDASARKQLEALAEQRGTTPNHFLDPMEFRKYAGEDWFVTAAFRAWGRHRDSIAPEDLAAKVLGVRKEDLLTLGRASADPTEKVGSWAVWTGEVKDAKLNRDAGLTLIEAGGVDAAQRLTVFDRKLVKVETQQRRVSVGRSVWEGTPTYDTEETYEEEFVANGKAFIARVRGIDEKLLDASYVVAIGRYVASPEGGPALLDALVIVPRSSRKTVKKKVD